MQVPPPIETNGSGIVQLLAADVEDVVLVVDVEAAVDAAGDAVVT